MNIKMNLIKNIDHCSESVWLDLGGGMEPDDQGWEAIIQSLRHDPTLEQ